VASSSDGDTVTTPSIPSDGREPSEAEERAAFDRRKLLTRAAVGGAIVWTVPMITKRAYASGATSCANQVLDWNTFAVNSTFTSTIVAGTTISINSATFYGGTTANATNHKVQASPYGGITGQSLEFNQVPKANGGQIITFTFSKTVYSVSFMITDIDNLSGSWQDRVIVVSPASGSYSYSMPTGSTVIGNGQSTGSTTTTGPFRNSVASNNYPNTSPGGNVQITMPGPLTTFTFNWESAIGGGTTHLIRMGNISFCA
jgi:hypothetical protein